MHATTSVAVSNVDAEGAAVSTRTAIVWDFKILAEMSGTSIATINRCEREDPDFPPTFRYRPKGKKYLTAGDGREWIMKKRREAAAAR